MIFTVDEISIAYEIEKHLVQIRGGLGAVRTRRAFMEIAELADSGLRLLDAKNETQPSGENA